MKPARPSQSPVPQAMLDYLLENYSVGDEFVAMDLYPVAKKFTDALRSCTSNQLRVLVACGCITRKSKRIKTDKGGSNLIVYALTGKTKVEIIWKERPHKPKAKKAIVAHSMTPDLFTGIDLCLWMFVAGLKEKKRKHTPGEDKPLRRLV